jgi:Uma2 family endonuclease
VSSSHPLANYGQSGTISHYTETGALLGPGVDMTKVMEAVLPLSPVVQTTEGGQRVILHGVSWATYTQLLEEHQEDSSIHFAYDRGELEIMVLSPKHEALKHNLALLVEVLAEAMGIDVYSLGSTTFQRPDLARGFEPDACFYIQHEALVRAKDEIDLAVDPPPDLVIEIDITNPSLNKFPIFAALGITEVWRYNNDQVMIFSLQAGSYREQIRSTVFPPVTSAILTQFMTTSRQLKRTLWLQRVRQWAQS